LHDYIDEPVDEMKYFTKSNYFVCCEWQGS